MKKFVMISLVGAALSLSACAADGQANYTYENEAPYASERTVGTSGATTTTADTMYSNRQRK
jgi:hypothetical protein